MKKIFLYFILFTFISGSVSLQLFAGEISLSSGWNLITVPISDSSTSITSYLSTHLTTGTVQKIWNYEGGWSSYTPNTSSVLVDFKQNRGYWFLMGSEGGTLNFSDSSTFQGIQFSSSGWSLASFNQTTDLSAVNNVFLEESIKSNHELSNIGKVWGYSDIGWESFTPSNQSGELTTLRKGKGFWFLLQSTTNFAIGTEALEIIPNGASSSEPVTGTSSNSFNLAPLVIAGDGQATVSFNVPTTSTNYRLVHGYNPALNLSQAQIIEQANSVRPSVNLTNLTNGSYFFAVAFGNDTQLVDVYQFELNENFGRLNFQQVYTDGNNGFDGLLRVQNLAFNNEGEHLYSVSAFASNGIEDNTVALYQRTTSTGNLIATTFLLNAAQAHGNPPQALSWPRDLVFNTAGDRAYLASYNAGKIGEYYVSNEGILSPRSTLGQSDAGTLFGAQYITRSSDGKDLYVVGKNDVDVNSFAGITVINTHDFQVIQSLSNTGNLTGLWPSCIVVSPDGQRVLANSVTPGKIWNFSRNVNTGEISLSSTIDQTSISNLNGLSEMVFSPDGNHLYAISGNPGNAVLVFKNQVDGNLSLVQEITTTNVAALSNGISIDISADGMNIYAIDYSGVSVFQRDLYSGQLTFKENFTNSSIGGVGLNAALKGRVSPDNLNLYVAAELDHAISQFSRNGTGTSTPTTVTAPLVITGTNALGLDQAILVSWSTLATAVTYTVYKSTAPGINVNDPSTYESRTQNISGNQLQISDLNNGTRVYFKVTGSNHKGEGVSSTEFSVIPSAIQATELCNLPLLKANPSTTSLIITASTTENADSFNLSWNAVLNASSYDLTISLPEEQINFGALTDISSIENTFLYDANVGGISFAGNEWYSSFVQNGRLWEFTISAKNTQNQTIASSTKQLRVGAPFPEKIKFAHGSSGSTEAEINWCSSQSVTGYVVRYGTTSDNLDQFVNVAANLNSTLVSSLTNNTDYYFTVEAKNSHGSGDPSEIIKVSPGSSINPDFSIESVTFNQGVQLDLTTGTSSIPAVASKTGILRIFLNSNGPVDGVKAKVRLEVIRNSIALAPLVQEAVFYDSVKADSEEFAYPVFFELSGSYVDAGNSFSILIDPDNDVVESNENNNRFPASGERSFGLETQHVIRIRLVPITVSGRTVDLSTQVVQQFKDYMVAMYPNHDMLVEVRPSAVLPTSNVPAADNGWDTALDEFDDFRSNDIAANERDIFYYGALKSMTDAEYANGNGGILGLGYINDSFSNNMSLSSIGLSFNDVFIDTAAHEIGHNHGRPHVGNTGEFNDSCSPPDGPDNDYPYNFARIQKMGYDFVNRKLFSGYAFHDIMTYCGRVWISDYTYKKLHDFQDGLHNQFTIPSASISKVEFGLAKQFRFLDAPEGIKLTGVKEIDFVGLIEGHLRLVGKTSDGLEINGSASRIRMDHSISTSIIGVIPTDENLIKLQLWDDENLLFEQQVSSHSVSSLPSSEWLEKSGNQFLIRKGSEGRRVVRISKDNGNTFRVLAFDNNDKDLWFSALSGNIVEIQFSLGINVFIDRIVIE